MKTKLIISLYLLLASITVQASLPQGKWLVEEVSIEKNTDGKIETSVYRSAAEVKSLYKCSQEWDISPQNIVIRYTDGREETVPSYTVEGDRLTLVSEMLNPLQYSVEGDKLTLITSYNYVNNLPTGQVERIDEKWTIRLKK